MTQNPTPSAQNSRNRSNSQSRANAPVSVELKGSVFTLTVLCLRSFDVEAISRELSKRIEHAPRFFENAPIVLDFKDLMSIDQVFHIKELLDTLRHKHRLFPVGVRHTSPAQSEAALAAGLAVMQGGGSGAAIETVAVQSEASAQNHPAPKAGQDESPIVEPSAGALLVEHPIRSGQQVYARGGDLIITAAVNAGAEVLADGNIHIYAPLRGRALAGIKGDERARIFCQSMEAELIAIAGNYRVFDEVPEPYLGKAVQVYLQDDRLHINPMGR